MLAQPEQSEVFWNLNSTQQFPGKDKLRYSLI